MSSPFFLFNKSVTFVLLFSIFFASSAMSSPQNNVDVLDDFKSVSEEFRKQKDVVDVLETEYKELRSQANAARDDYESALSLRKSLKGGVGTQLDKFFDSGIGEQQIILLLTQYSEQSKVVADKQATLSEREKLFSDYSAKREKEISKLAFLDTQLSLHKETEDRKLIAQLSEDLKQEVNFSRDLRFRCPSGLTLRQCLDNKNFESDLPQWISEHYVKSLNEMGHTELEGLLINREHFSYSSEHTFSSAQVDLNNIVSARVNFSVKTKPHRVMPCVLLGLKSELCNFQYYSLQVRSNKHEDEVFVNGKSHGSTPVFVSLESGNYDLEVRYAGSSRTKKIKLESDKKVFFNF